MTSNDARPESTIVRHTVIALDCPDGPALAGFYAELTGQPIERSDGGWTQLESNGTFALAFEQVDGEYRAPQWPGQEVPQQLHLDFAVDDLDAGEQFVLGLGATKPEPNSEHPDSFRVFLDPAGHPFCLVTSG